MKAKILAPSPRPLGLSCTDMKKWNINISVLLLSPVTPVKALNTLCQVMRGGGSHLNRPQKFSYKSLVSESLWVLQRRAPGRHDVTLKLESCFAKSALDS